MARRPPAFVLNQAEARHLNIAHGLYPRESMTSTVLTALVKYLRDAATMRGGRVYAGGLTKFEPREMERIPVPEPRHALGNHRVKTPPVWSEDELDGARQRAEDHFRESRHTEPLEVYLELFDEYQGIVEEVMEETVDLTRLEECALDMMSDKRKREVFSLPVRAASLRRRSQGAHAGALARSQDAAH